MWLSRLDGDVSAARRKINYLHPLLLLQSAGKNHSSPDLGKGGGWSRSRRRWRRRSRRSLGNLCVTCPDMPKSATYLWRLHSQGTRLRFFFFLKASSAGLTWQNKAGTELNDVALGKKVWCDYIAFFPPCVMEGRELCCSKDAELYFKKEMAVSSATAGGESLLCLFFFFFKYLTCWLFFFMTGRNEQRPIRLHV